jgi:hypothetical protein
MTTKRLTFFADCSLVRKVCPLALLAMLAAGASCEWGALAQELQTAGAALCPPDPSAQRAHGAHLHRYPRWDIEGYSQQAAGTIIAGFHAQAQNGNAIELTLWNHHFEDGPSGENGEKARPSDKLHRSALALLHRIARRYADQPDFLVLVQTAHDIEFTSDQLDGYAHQVDQLNAARVAAVKNYLAKVLRRPDARVMLHDPPVVGMSTVEMQAAYDNMIRYGPRSVLETIDPEIRPIGSYGAPPGFVFAPDGSLVPIEAALRGQR